ncbi:MAG: hypothetical protein GY725_24535 [bacterium]|nr:hypothetical protein [bacterium]
MVKATRLFVGISILFGVAVATAAVLLPGSGTLAERLGRVLYVGSPLLEIRLPAAGTQVPVGSIEVLVGFPDSDRVAVDTFRCLLNDDDITERLTLGSNGAGGTIVGLVAGKNHLRLEVFGRSWWGGRYVQEVHRIPFEVRPFPYLDIAGRPILGTS